MSIIDRGASEIKPGFVPACVAPTALTRSPTADALRLLVGSDLDRLVEIRALNVEECDWRGPSIERIWSGTYFADEADLMARDAARVDGRSTGVYVLLNPITRDRRDRVRRTRKGTQVTESDWPLRRAEGDRRYGTDRMRQEFRTYRDLDIIERRAFLFDLDPVREAGQEKNPATDGERAAAFDLWAEVSAYLMARDWPQPTLVSTGNGLQPVFRCEPHPAASDLIPRVLKALARRFSTDRAKFDTTVGNPARICRLPGTLNCKGEASESRPHRRAEVRGAGDGRAVTLAQLEREAEGESPVVRSFATRPPKSSGASDAGPAITPSEARATPPRSDGEPWAPYTGRTPLTTEVERAAERICQRAEPAVFGNHGSRPLLTAIRQVMTGLDLAPDVARGLIERHYMPRCNRGITDREITRAVDNVSQTPNRMPAGCLLPGRKRRKLQPVGYEDLTAEEAAALAATAPPQEFIASSPGECPYAARDDVRELLQPRSCKNCTWWGVERESTGVAGTAAKGCHDPRCRACVSQRVAKVLRTDLDWMIEQTAPDRPGGAMRIDAMVITPENREAVIKAAARAGAPCRWVNTAAGAEVRAVLEMPGDGLSVLVHRGVPNSYAQERTVNRDGHISTLVLTLRPLDAEPMAGTDYRATPVSTARGIRALGEALATIPPAPPRDFDGALRRHVVWGRSGNPRKSKAADGKPVVDRRWGVDLVTTPGDLVFGARTVVTGPETTVLTDELGYTAPFVTGSDRVQGRVAGYRGPSGAHTLMLRLLLTAADYPRLAGSPRVPTLDRIRDAAWSWHEILLPLNCGKGPEVAAALRRQLWHPPICPDDVRTELRAADERDRVNAPVIAARKAHDRAERAASKKREQSLHAEAASLLRSLREHFRGREHEATGLIAELLA